MIRVRVVQAEPVWFDLQSTVDKTLDLIEEAGTRGISILGFPEVWIPGYPW
jgi:predicted amidohydrolase